MKHMLKAYYAVAFVAQYCFTAFQYRMCKGSTIQCSVCLYKCHT